MAEYSIVQNDVITNIVEAEEGVAAGMGWILTSEGHHIGWKHNGTTFAPVVDIPKLVEEKKAEIQAQYDGAIAHLESAYTQKERDTWPQQVTEARAYQLDPVALTPLIDAMLISRPGDTREGLSAKIITNYSAYSAIVGEALGIMQMRTAVLKAIDLTAPDAEAQIAAA